ncbi:hypothetical protein D3C71_1585840 [compost metagenome]
MCGNNICSMSRSTGCHDHNEIKSLQRSYKSEYDRYFKDWNNQRKSNISIGFESVSPINLCRFIQLIRDILNTGILNQQMVAKILPKRYCIKRKHRNFRFCDPIVSPAIQPKKDQDAIQHPAHGDRVIDRFPELPNDNHRQNNRRKVNRN